MFSNIRKAQNVHIIILDTNYICLKIIYSFYLKNIVLLHSLLNLKVLFKNF